ncbi:hypothetical protein VitviT2T_015158 [Vitis vinifera]|uniref:Uncharacterized protein n=2 Tax=Vitis vinifera TaxID=29760 RepID=A0ABY9CPB6_VITVI
MLISQYTNLIWGAEPYSIRDKGTCNNILAMTQPLHSKSPSFIGDKRINLSCKEATKPSVPSSKS